MLGDFVMLGDSVIGCVQSQQGRDDGAHRGCSIATRVAAWRGASQNLAKPPKTSLAADHFVLKRGSVLEFTPR